MTKQKTLEIYRKRQLMSEKERFDIDNLLFETVRDIGNSFRVPNPYETIKSLLDNGADPNFYKNGKTVVHLLSIDYFKYLELVTEYGGDLTAQTKSTGDYGDYGYTPLHYACGHGLRENVELILEHLQKQGKLDDVIAVQTKLYEYSPRICASQGSERTDVHKILDKYHVPHNLPDSKMRTELSWSASFDDIDAVNHLRETGSLAIIYDNNGKAHKASNTPQLSIAARKILLNMEKEELAFENSHEMSTDRR